MFMLEYFTVVTVEGTSEFKQLAGSNFVDILWPFNYVFSLLM